jgi:hypothetical protein
MGFIIISSISKFQSMSATNNATAAGQHVDHTLDNLIISEHIHLAGQLARRDFDTQYGDSLVSGKT